jgi:hypothetical protein
LGTGEAKENWQRYREGQKTYRFTKKDNVGLDEALAAVTSRDLLLFNVLLH